MNSFPEISVVMSVYNGVKFLKPAIDSILDQTFSDFEFIIIDDASTDESAKIISEYTDSRISLFRNESNKGLAYSLNRGLKLSRGKYIARMDADDLSVATRFEKQFNFLETNKNVDLCGSWISFIGKNKNFKPPVNDSSIKALLFRTNCIPHPSIMFRRQLLTDKKFFYDETFRNSQDYELYSRFLNELTYTNIPEILLEYRVHDDQISTAGSLNQSVLADKIRILNLKRLLQDINEEEKTLHLILMNKMFDKYSYDYMTGVSWLNNLIRVNKQKKVYPIKEFNLMILQLKHDLREFVWRRTLGKDSLILRLLKRFNLILKGFNSNYVY